MKILQEIRQFGDPNWLPRYQKDTTKSPVGPLAVESLEVHLQHRALRGFSDSLHVLSLE